MNTYSLLKSRTFWLLVIASLLPIGNAIVPTLPMGVQDIVEIVLSVLAMITHNDTAQRSGAIN